MKRERRAFLVRFLPRGWWGHVPTARGAGLSRAPGPMRGPPGTFPALGAPCHTALGGAIPSRGRPCSLRAEPAALPSPSAPGLPGGSVQLPASRTAPCLPAAAGPGDKEGRGQGRASTVSPPRVSVWVHRGCVLPSGSSSVPGGTGLARVDPAGPRLLGASGRGLSERCGSQGVLTEPLGGGCGAHQLSPGSWR